MHGAVRAKQYDAAGSLGSGERVQAYVFTPKSDAASSGSIKSGGTSGTVVLTLSSPAGGPTVVVGPLAITAPYLSAITAGALLSVLE
jgi:hypothetical protein